MEVLVLNFFTVYCLAIVEDCYMKNIAWGKNFVPDVSVFMRINDTNVR